jgi:tetratricopeptide (TPR) repeat protein
MRPGRPDLSQMAEVVARIEAIAATSTHPMLIMASVIVTVLNGDLDGARQILARLSGHPEPWLAAAGTAFGGYLAVNDGDIDAAAAALAAGYAAFGEIGDRWAMSVCLNGQAQVAMARDDADGAVRLLEEARKYASASGLGLNWGEMMSIPLGHARAVSGDLAGARADIERGVGFAGRTGEHDDEASGYIELSEVARRSGDLAGARGLVERALEIISPRAERMEMHSVTAAAWTKLGAIAEQEGDLAAAARWHARSLAILADPQAVFLPSNPGLAAVVEGIAALAAARGEHDRAAELLGLAHALQGFRNRGSLESNRAAAAATSALDAPAFAAAYARGRQLTRADALALIP